MILICLPVVHHEYYSLPTYCVMWQCRCRWPVGGPHEIQPRGQPVTVPTRQPCRGSPAARFPLIIYLSLAVHSSSCQSPSSSISPFSSLLCWVWHQSSNPFANTGYPGQGPLNHQLLSGSYDIEVQGPFLWWWPGHGPICESPLCELLCLDGRAPLSGPREG